MHFLWTDLDQESISSRVEGGELVAEEERFWNLKSVRMFDLQYLWQIKQPIYFILFIYFTFI